MPKISIDLTKKEATELRKEIGAIIKTAFVPAWGKYWPEPLQDAYRKTYLELKKHEKNNSKRFEHDAKELLAKLEGSK